MNYDVVGSFLPTPELVAARADYDKGVISAEEYRKCEDTAIRDIVERQIAAGLTEVTSGELRRRDWDKDFYFGLNGITRERIEQGRVYQSEFSFSDLLRISGKIACNPDHPFIADFKALADMVGGRAVCRQTIPSPTDLYMRVVQMTDGDVTRVYDDRAALRADITAAYRDTMQCLYNAGCRHIQLDDTVLSRFADPEYLGTLMTGGIDPIELHSDLVALINDSFKGLPADLDRSIYISAGDSVVPRWYVPFGGSRSLAEILGELNVNRYYLPFGTNTDDKALRVLANIPEGRQVALGVINPHMPFPDNDEDVVAVVRDAEQYIPAARLALSPMCGFKLSEYTMRGLTYLDQWHKLDELAALAKRL